MSKWAGLPLNVWQVMAAWLDGADSARCRRVCTLWNARIQRTHTLVRMQQMHIVCVQDADQLTRAIGCDPGGVLQGTRHEVMDTARSFGWHGEDQDCIYDMKHGAFVLVNNFYYRSSPICYEDIDNMQKLTNHLARRYRVTWKLIEFPFCSDRARAFVVCNKRFHRGACFLIRFDVLQCSLEYANVK